MRIGATAALSLEKREVTNEWFGEAWCWDDEDGPDRVTRSVKISSAASASHMQAGSSLEPPAGQGYEAAGFAFGVDSGYEPDVALRCQTQEGDPRGADLEDDLGVPPLEPDLERMRTFDRFEDAMQIQERGPGRPALSEEGAPAPPALGLERATSSEDTELPPPPLLELQRVATDQDAFWQQRDELYQVQPSGAPLELQEAARPPADA